MKIITKKYRFAPEYISDTIAELDLTMETIGIWHGFYKSGKRFNYNILGLNGIDAG